MKKENKNNELIKKLYRDEYSFFYKVAYCILNNEMDAEDAVGESVFKIYKYINRISNAEYPKIKAYFANVVKSVSINMKKRQSKIICSEFYESLIDSADFSEGSDAILERMFENKNLYALLEKLSVKERAIIKFKIIDELAFKEISEIVSISEEAARKRYQRALKKLQKLMEARK